MSDESRGDPIQKKLGKQTKSIETLKRLLTYYQEITDTIIEPFLILNKDLQVVTANQAFYSMFKVAKLETEGKLIYQLGNNQWDSAKLRELLENILPKQKVMNGFEVTHKFPGIGSKTMLLNARQIDSKQLILLAIQDITKEKKLERDTKRMTKSLVQQKDKLQALSDSKEEFISMASHQLRTPATAVKLYTAMLQEGYAGDLTDAQLNMLEKVIANNERQLEVIEDMLRVARADDGKVYLEKSDCDITHLIQGVIKEQLGVYASHNQKTVFETADGHISAYIDANLMRMVLENLLDNASKYSQDHTTVTVTLEQANKQTTITITDAGVGVPRKDQKKIFTKFSRLNNSLSLSTAGTGLGLYWVKKIVDLHQGSIGVTSKVEQGTSFTLKLPLVSTPMAPEIVELI